MFSVETWEYNNYGKTLSNINVYRLTDIVITTPMIINMETPTPTVPPTVICRFDEGCAIIKFSTSIKYF